MKVLVSLLIALGATQAMAGTQTFKPLLNGISYGVSQACFDGSSLVAMVTKSRDLIRENGQGDRIVVGKVTVNAGDAFPWRNAKSVRQNSQGDDIVVSFSRNGRPAVVKVKTDSDGTEVSRTYIAFPYCQ